MLVFTAEHVTLAYNLQVFKDIRLKAFQLKMSSVCLCNFQCLREGGVCCGVGFKPSTNSFHYKHFVGSDDQIGYRDFTYATKHLSSNMLRSWEKFIQWSCHLEHQHRV